MLAISLNPNILQWQVFVESRQRKNSKVPQACTGRVFTSKADSMTHYFFWIPSFQLKRHFRTPDVLLPFLQGLHRQFLTFYNSLLLINCRHLKNIFYWNFVRWANLVYYQVPPRDGIFLPPQVFLWMGQNGVGLLNGHYVFFLSFYLITHINWIW